MEELEFTPTPGPFLKFVDEAAWLTAARAAGLMIIITDEEGNETEKLQAYTSSHAIDVIGTITKGGEWDDEGNEIVAPTVLGGWHVNFLGKLPEGWESYEVAPSNPYRVFA
jgi:hypothetical protein